MKKKIKVNLIFKRGIILIFFLIMCFFLTGCSNSESDESKLKEKVKEELRYLDSQIISIMNSLNDIHTENYIVVSKQIEDSTSKESEEKKSTSEGNDSQEKSTSEGNDSQEKSTDNSDTSTSKEQKSSNKTSDIEADNILTRKEEIDWTTIKTNMENMYHSWSTILLDLYSLKLDNQEILNFSEKLDVATNQIKDEKKKESLDALANLYDSIPNYLAGINQTDQDSIHLYYAKSHILHAYAYIESQNWTEVQNRISKAEEDISKILEGKQEVFNPYNINKIYVLLKEVESAAQKQDTDIFYIKYKNIMEEITAIID